MVRILKPLLRIIIPYRSCSIMSEIEKAKKNSACKAVDDYIQDGMKVGIGSGSTIVYAVERLAERIRKERLRIVCIPTSFQAKQLINEHQLTLSDFEQTTELDVTIDGADEIDANLTLIKGGGGCLLQEKIVAYNSKKMIVIADFTKNSITLGQKWKGGIPLEVLPMAYYPIKLKIESMYKGECVLRMAKHKAGPIVTDNGNFILDWKNFESDLNWKKVNNELLAIPGLIETGLFIEMCEKAFIGLADGSVLDKISSSPTSQKTCTQCQ